MLKIVAAVRRKPGMTHAEFIDYIVNVHGKIARAEPLGLKRYVQNHVYDGCFGSNEASAYTVPFHRDSVTELYFETAADMAATFSHEYTRTVVGPDAANFAELSTNEATLTVETEILAPADRTSGTKILHFLIAADAERVGEAQQAWQDCHNRALDKVPAFAAALAGLTRSDAVIEPANKAMAAYFGGSDRPPLALVVSYWLPDDKVSAFRAYEAALFEKDEYAAETSYFLMTREVEIFSV